MVLNQKNTPIFPISPLFQIFSPIFFDDLLNIGLPPPETPDSARVPIAIFYKNWGKKRISEADRQKPISDS